MSRRRIPRAGKLVSKWKWASRAETMASPAQAAGAGEAAGFAGCDRREPLSRLRQSNRLVEQRSEALRLEQAAAHTVGELELVEDLLGGGLARLGRPFLPEPRTELAVTIGRLEHAPDDELRRDRSVPPVLLEAEGDIEAPLAARPVEVGAEPEGDGEAGGEPVS